MLFGESLTTVCAKRNQPDKWTLQLIRKIGAKPENGQNEKPNFEWSKLLGKEHLGPSHFGSLFGVCNSKALESCDPCIRQC